LHAHRYSLQNKDLQNSTLNSVEGPQYYAFGPSGLENLTAAVGVPLFVSKPHFLDGSSILQANVYGMVPHRESHDTYLDIEPRTGALVRAHKRLQVRDCTFYYIMCV
jgi:lysosome membrane protein 2